MAVAYKARSLNASAARGDTFAALLQSKEYKKLSHINNRDKISKKKSQVNVDVFSVKLIVQDMKELKNLICLCFKTLCFAGDLLHYI